MKRDGKGAPYLLLWPHARPWQFSWPQPTLRGLDDAQSVAEALAERLRAALREEMDQAAQKAAAPDPEAMARYEQELKDRAEARAIQERVHNARAIASERRQRPFVLALFGLALASLLVVAAIRIFDPPQRFHEVLTPVASYELAFVKEDGNLRVVDMRDQTTLGVIGPTGEGLLRNAQRGLERTRQIEGLDLAASYQLIVWPEDKITLSDPLTDRHIPLTSFLPMRNGILGELKAMTVAPE